MKKQQALKISLGQSFRKISQQKPVNPLFKKKERKNMAYFAKQS